MRDFIYSVCLGCLWGATVVLPMAIMLGATTRAAAVLVLLLVVLCALVALLPRITMPGER